ncbi:MAG: hypothetical protein MUC42_16820, partial [Bryobacter sp.]|nr:hypothetical protein [Bryobacter sp.]
AIWIGNSDTFGIIETLESGTGSGYVFPDLSEDDMLLKRRVFESETMPDVGSGTFQLQLFSAGPVLARFVYQDVDFGNSSYDNGASATIGYQASGIEAYQFSLNNAVLANGDVIDIRLQDDGIPEPSTMLLGATALLALGALRRLR